MKGFKTFAIFVFLFVLMPPNSALAALKVMVDPGHGGFDPGALGVNGLYEKTITLDIALKLRDELQKRGFNVNLTRDSDIYLSLSERVAIAERANADLFVSVHANSHISPLTQGSLVLYYDSQFPQASYPASEAMSSLSPASKQLAELVLQNVVKQTGLQNRGIIPSAAYVIRIGTVPSILVETAFLSNWQDAIKLADEQMRNRFAVGIAEGVASFQPPVFLDLIGHWAQEAVLRMKDKGILEGETDHRFMPDRSLTRAEFFTVMGRMFPAALREAPSQQQTTEGTDPVNAVTYGSSLAQPAGALSVQNEEIGLTYTDLRSTHWAYDTIRKAAQLGYLGGYPDGTIRPDRPITRSEAAAIFQRFLAQTNRLDPAAGTLLVNPFTDVPANNWAAPAVYLLRNIGVLNGVSDNRFFPERPMSRAEVAAMVDKYYALNK